MTAFPHWERFDLERLTVTETKHWVLSVRPKQVTLASCVLLLKRAVPSLSQLRPDEAEDLARVAAEFERRTTERFKPDRFNYVAAMMKDPYLHFHAFPRYEAHRELGGITWSDTDWPKVINMSGMDESGPVVDEICRALR